MSRIGRLAIAVPSGVDVQIDGATVKVKGPKGQLEHVLAPAISIVKNEDGTLAVSRANDERLSKSLHGLSRTLVNNMVLGVTEGYVKDLEIQGVGFKANLKGSQLDLALGYSHPVLMEIPEGIKVTVTEQTKLKVEGADKQLVGAVTAEIRGYYPPEPYKGKGVRIVGERVRRKEGKTVA